MRILDYIILQEQDNEMLYFVSHYEFTETAQKVFVVVILGNVLINVNLDYI